MGDLKIGIKKLDRISPSKFTALKRCPYKVVLSNSFSYPLLPYSPKNHLGNVIHSCIDLIYQRKINNIDEFNLAWDSLVEKEEKKLVNMGFDFYIPLKENVEGYTIKKLQTKALIQIESNKSTSIKCNRNSDEILTEKWLESMDGNIGGYVDFIYRSDNFTELSDFKTGNILEDEGEIKKDYEDQLKLYAYLYFQNYDDYPDSLSIVDLQKNKYFIDFHSEECEEIARASKNLLIEINRLIAANDFSKLAKPEEENCSKCLYRPACKFNSNFEDKNPDSLFRDLNGTLVKYKQFINGDINATIKLKDKTFKIYHIKESFMPFLSEVIDTKIAFFNLKKIDEFKYKFIKTTKIFEFPEN